MDDLIEQFLLESRELIHQASADFARLAERPTDSGSVESAFRAIHTLKGSVAVFSFDPAERVLHRAEDLLELGRKGTVLLGRAELDGLVGCLDQVDRWIEEVERGGTLGDNADVLAAVAIARLDAPGGGASVPVIAPPGPGAPDRDSAKWAELLVQRQAASLETAGSLLTAFRYVPAADCFFLGDDPLAIAAAVPDLVTLEILPVAGEWPSADEIEPFTCISALEGLSGAPVEDVRAAFRLVADQVSVTVVDPLAGETADADSGKRRIADSVRVNVEHLDALADRLGELLVGLNGLGPIAAAIGAVDAGVAARMRAADGELQRIGNSLRGAVEAVRSVSLEPTLRRLPRIAREVAASMGKDIAFSISGQKVVADRQIAEGLYEPLLHLLRNALDHGIESSDRRVEAGKPPQGRISLRLKRDGETIEALLEDDGGGIDTAAVRRIAVERGLLDEVSAAQLSEKGAAGLIFAPGFSTAETITSLSGRGVGMNAVKVAIEAMRGTIEVDSRLGQGTVFRMRLPANALTTRLLIIEAGGDRYAVALDQVVETVRMSNAELLPVGNGTACVLRGRTVPVLGLGALLGCADASMPHAKLLVARSRGETVAFRVEAFGERINTMVRPPRGLLKATPGIMGSALLGDGGVVLVLDLEELAA